MMMVAIFSFHMIASGYRSLYHKRVHEGQKPGRLDLVLQGVAAVVSGDLMVGSVSGLGELRVEVR